MRDGKQRILQERRSAGGKYHLLKPGLAIVDLQIANRYRALIVAGGLLTSEALARNSDIFKAGVDLAGVHLEGNSLDPESVSSIASAISAVDGWKSFDNCG